MAVSLHLDPNFLQLEWQEMLNNKAIRTWSKTGMVISLGTLVWTGIGRGCINHKWHTWAGIALIGFSVWHYNAYNPPCWKRIETGQKGTKSLE
jgi:hypothetical protein